MKAFAKRTNVGKEKDKLEVNVYLMNACWIRFSRIVYLGMEFGHINLLSDFNFTNNMRVIIAKYIQFCHTSFCYSSTIKQKGESQNGCCKKTKHAWYAKAILASLKY